MPLGSEMPPGEPRGGNIEVVVGDVQPVIKHISLKVLVGFSLPFIYEPGDNVQLHVFLLNSCFKVPSLFRTLAGQLAWG